MESTLVAVVDDENAVRVALARLLRLAGYEVAGFGDGETFLASLERRVPACVLLDVNMPGLSGLQVLERLAADRVDVPVILVSASDDPAVDRMAHEAGVPWMLHKPFASSALMAAIQSALKAPPP